MDKTSEVGKLNAFGTSVGKSDIHLRVQRDKMLYYFCTLPIRSFSSRQNVSSCGFDSFQPGFKCSVHLSVNQEVKITVKYEFKNCGVYKRGFTILTDGGIVLFHETKIDPVSSGGDPQEDIVSVTGDDFQELKKRKDDTFLLTYRIIGGVNELISKHIYSNFAISNSEYLKSLQTDLKNCSSAYLNVKVSLCVGSEAEVVNKAVLCVRSPVFAQMLNGNMQEKSNTVIITDIKMPVVRALASFLCSGLLCDQDFDFLCDLYYAANKYDIWELHQACVRLLLDKVTSGNVTRVLKLAVLHNDEMLKSAAMTLISANIESVALARDWKDLMCDDPVLALKASTFFDF